MQKVKSILSLIVLLSVLLSVAVGAGYLLLMLPLLVGLPVGVAFLAVIALIGIYLYERGK